VLLSYDELLSLIHKGLIEDMIDLKTQLQPNGVELTLRRVEVYNSYGTIAFDNSERSLPETTTLKFDKEGWIHLPKGCYKIIFNEIINIPKNIAAIARPRSSLLRCGVSIETAVWDAGYRGRSESLLVVHNENGFRVKRNARLLQLIFFKLNKASKGYSGRYQNENID